MFSLGEFFLSLSGHSYMELEQRFENRAGACSEIVQAKPSSLSPSEKPVKVDDVPAIDGRSIGMTLLDLLASGCRGNLKLVHERFRIEENGVSPNKTEVKTDFESTYDKTFRDLVFMKARSNAPFLKELNPHDRYQNKLEIKLGDRLGHTRHFQNVILDEETNIDFQHSGGTLQKGEYSYRYKVTKNEDKKLRVELEGTTAEAWNHNNTGLKTAFAFVAQCMSLEELESNSLKAQEQKEKLKLENAVFSGP